MSRLLRHGSGALRGLFVLSLFSLLAGRGYAAPRPAATSAVLAARPEPAPIGGHSVVLTWTPSPDGGAYSIYRTTTSGTYGSPLATSVATNCSGTACTYTDTSVSVGTYYYTATTVVNGAESVKSNEATARILPSPPSGLAAAGQ
jgi:hypothetical protein